MILLLLSRELLSPGPLCLAMTGQGQGTASATTSVARQHRFPRELQALPFHLPVGLWTPPCWAMCLCLGPSCAVTAGYTGHRPPGAQPHAEPRQAWAGRRAGVHAPLGNSPQQPHSSSSPGCSHLTCSWEETESLPSAAAGLGLAAAAEGLLQGLTEAGFPGERSFLLHPPLH